MSEHKETIENETKISQNVQTLHNLINLALLQDADLTILGISEKGAELVRESCKNNPEYIKQILEEIKQRKEKTEQEKVKDNMCKEIHMQARELENMGHTMINIARAL